jgi:hypothetical protein
MVLLSFGCVVEKYRRFFAGLRRSAKKQEYKRPPNGDLL